ncbi:MAG TPA: hypothetical protein VI078_14915 [bacterium]
MSVVINEFEVVAESPPAPGAPEVERPPTMALSLFVLQGMARQLAERALRIWAD